MLEKGGHPQWGPRPSSLRHGGSGARRINKGVLALIIAVPLLLGGIRAGFIYDEVRKVRANGLLEPPVNPFLSAEEAKRLPVRKKSH